VWAVAASKRAARERAQRNRAGKGPEASDEHARAQMFFRYKHFFALKSTVAVFTKQLEAVTDLT
jgi:hypothetical protein